MSCGIRQRCAHPSKSTSLSLTFGSDACSPRPPPLLPFPTSRETVARVTVIDLLSSTWIPATTPIGEDDGSIKLAFLNVAGGRSILDDSADAKGRLRRTVSEIAGILDDRGSLAIAMESTVSFNYKHIKGARGATDW